MSTAEANPTNSNLVEPLCNLPAGTKATVVALAGGHGFQNRIVSMGINVGSRIEVLNNAGNCNRPTLVACGDTRLAVGRGMAEKVLVERER